MGSWRGEQEQPGGRERVEVDVGIRRHGAHLRNEALRERPDVGEEGVTCNGSSSSIGISMSCSRGGRAGLGGLDCAARRGGAGVSGIGSGGDSNRRWPLAASSPAKCAMSASL